MTDFILIMFKSTGRPLEIGLQMLFVRYLNLFNLVNCIELLTSYAMSYCSDLRLSHLY